MPRLRGAIPSPRYRLAAATPHIATTPTPTQWLWRPPQLSFWLNNIDGDCVTAEEAFAKGCAVDGPGVFITDAIVQAWATSNNVLNGAELTQVLDLMLKGGFVMDSKTYDDGPAKSVDWTDVPTLQNAIAQGPVKIGVAADQLENVVPEPPTNGWFATGFTQDPNEDHCVSLCGYGTIAWLAEQLGVPVPNGVDGAQQAYALFTWSSIGIITFDSLIAICAEAWLRVPTTVVN